MRCKRCAKVRGFGAYRAIALILMILLPSLKGDASDNRRTG